MFLCFICFTVFKLLDLLFIKNRILEKLAERCIFSFTPEDENGHFNGQSQKWQKNNEGEQLYQPHDEKQGNGTQDMAAAPSSPLEKNRKVK